MQEIDFKQDFKDYADAWKFLKKSVKSEDYVCVNIGYYRRDMSYIDRIEGKAWVKLYRYDLPRAMYERWQWVIEWRIAKCKCQHPREDVSSTTCYYDKKTGDNDEALAMLNQMHNHLVQLLRKTRQLEDLKEKQKKQLFLLDYDNQQIVKLQNEIERRKSEYLRLRDEYNKQIS